METFSALLALCEGNSPVTGEFPAQRPVTRSFDVFFDLRLSEQSWGWWFETPSRSLWRHSNAFTLQQKCHHFDKIVVTGCYGSCQNDNISVSVYRDFTRESWLWVVCFWYVLTHRKMACVAIVISKSMLAYISELWIKIHHNFHSQKFIWKRYLQNGLNSLKPNDAYMRHQPKQSLVQIMACRLAGAKPLSEWMLEYCKLIVARWTCENGPFLTLYWCHQSLGYLRKIWMPVVNIHWCLWTLKGLNI